MHVKKKKEEILDYTNNHAPCSLTRIQSSGCLREELWILYVLDGMQGFSLFFFLCCCSSFCSLKSDSSDLSTEVLLRYIVGSAKFRGFCLPQQDLLALYSSFPLSFFAACSCLLLAEALLSFICFQWGVCALRMGVHAGEAADAGDDDQGDE